MSRKFKGIVSEVICSMFILLFVYASLSKLADFEKFKSQLHKSPILSVYSGIVAWVVPITELILAFLLAGKRYQYRALHGSFF